MHLSQWARTPQRLRLLGAGVEVRNEGLPLSLSDPSSSLMLPGRPRLTDAVAPCLSPAPQPVLSRCALEPRTGSHRPALSRTRAEVRTVPALDMPPSQTRSEKTHHELLAYPPDLHAPKVEGNVAVSQDLATSTCGSAENSPFPPCAGLAPSRSRPALRYMELAFSIPPRLWEILRSSYPRISRSRVLHAHQQLSEVGRPQSSLSMSSTRQP